MRLTLRCALKSVLPPIDGCRGGQSRPPLRGSNGNAFVQRAGRCTPRVLASLRGHRPLRKNRRETVRRGGCPHPPVSPSVKTFGFNTSLAEGDKGSSAPVGAGRRIPTGALRPRNDRLFRQFEHKKEPPSGGSLFVLSRSGGGVSLAVVEQLVGTLQQQRTGGGDGEHDGPA